MNKLKAIFFSLLIVPFVSNAVDVYDEEYESDGHISFVLKQGEVSEQIVSLMKKMYPSHNVVFRQNIGGYLPTDLELSGANREIISVEMLAGMGLSACVYKNSIIEIGKFKKRGICSTAKLPNGKYPDVKKVARGTLSFTDEWYGNFDLVQQESVMKASHASFSTSHYDGKVDANDNLELQKVVAAQEVVNTSEVATDIVVQPSPTLVSFEIKDGQLLPQIEKLALKLKNSPKVVWELDDNLQWFNDKVIEGESYEEIFARILFSYDAFADVYLNDVVIVREAEGL